LRGPFDNIFLAILPAEIVALAGPIILGEILSGRMSLAYVLTWGIPFGLASIGE
jgi:hypothetical protein